jgi:hypothetical protein
MEIMDLLKVFSAPTYKSDYANAKATNTCIRCGNTIAPFSNISAKVEYLISALCQQCQDECFKR